MLAADGVGVDVAVLEVEASPQQLGPNVVGDDARIRADESADAAWGGQRAGRVEATRDPAPLLAVPEELTASRPLLVRGMSGSPMRSRSESSFWV